MSALEEQYERLQPKVPVVRFGVGGARQTLAQLRNRWGVRPFDGVPAEVRVDVHHDLGLEIWRRLGDGASGQGTSYELEGSA